MNMKEQVRVCEEEHERAECLRVCEGWNWAMGTRSLRLFLPNWEDQLLSQSRKCSCLQGNHDGGEVHVKAACSFPMSLISWL